MANPGTIRTALRTRLASISGLTVYARWPSQIEVPCAIVNRGVAEPEQTFGRGELTKWMFPVHVFGGSAMGYEDAQDQLNRFIATSSTGGIFGAIAADRTLGGTVDTTFVKEITEDDQWDVQENISFLGFVVQLEVWSS